MTDYADLEKRLRDWGDDAQRQGDRVCLDATANFSAEARADLKASFFMQAELLRGSADALEEAKGILADLLRVRDEEFLPHVNMLDWSKRKADAWARATAFVNDLSRAVPSTETARSE